MRWFFRKQPETQMWDAWMAPKKGKNRSGFISAILMRSSNSGTAPPACLSQRPAKTILCVLCR